MALSRAPACIRFQQLPRLAARPRMLRGMCAESAAPAIEDVGTRAQGRRARRDSSARSRHGFASIGAAGGVSLSIIGALLGHKYTTTTARYAHLSADPLRAANDAVGARIAAAMGQRLSV